MKKCKRILSGFLSLSLVFLTVTAAKAAPVPSSELQFNSNGKFTVMVATDIHQSYYENDEAAATKTADMQKLLRAAIAEAKPDMVIFDGDNAFGKTEAEMRVSIARLLAPVAESNTPFAVVYGNHDTENGISLEAQLAIYQEYPTCKMADPVPALSGCATNNLVIKNSAGTKNAFNLWLMDSGSYSADPNIGGYAWVQDDQIAWYEQTSNALKAQNDGNPLPSLLFQHIPVPEIYELLRAPKLTELLDCVKGTVPWANGLYVAKDGVKGYVGEGPCPPTFNNGQFNSWVKQGDVLGAYFGHDHTNDFEGTVDGITLGYCKTAGFVPYGDGGRESVRIITLDENDQSTYETHMLTFKQLGLKADSLTWLQQSITDRQQTKLYVALAVSILLPIVGPLLALKYIKF